MPGGSSGASWAPSPPDTLLIDLIGTADDHLERRRAVLAVGRHCFTWPRSLPVAWGWAGLFLIAACLLSNWLLGAGLRELGERLALREAARSDSVIYCDESLYSHIEVRRVSTDSPDVRASLSRQAVAQPVSRWTTRSSLHYGYIQAFSDGLTRIHTSGRRTDLRHADHRRRRLRLARAYLETTLAERLDRGR